MKTIVTVVGARPQFIKASVVSRAIRSDGHLTELLVHTGQHFDDNMSAVFFSELDMAPPEHHLGISGGGHGEMTGRMLVELERLLQRVDPLAVLVYGDTNSTLAGALAAAKLNLPVAHVEAGLRSFNMKMPEEVNRVLTDRLSRWLFTPTDVAADHLRREGVSEERIIPVGDVMYDVVLQHGSRVDGRGRVIARLGLEGQRYVLVTVHRAENADDPHRLSIIVDALEQVAKGLPVVWPLHPRTRAALQRADRLREMAARIHLLEPVGYLDMVQLESQAAVIATDSGGVQKEAFFHRVPCVTLRDETEWTELIAAGWNRLAPPQSATRLSEAVFDALKSQGIELQPYGAGDASERIVSRLAGDLCA